MCGKRSVRNQPCFRAQAGSVSCGMACGALMPCGFHRCPASWWFPLHRLKLIEVIIMQRIMQSVLKSAGNHEKHVDMLVNSNGTSFISSS
jgi:hypothetical protein